MFRWIAISMLINSFMNPAFADSSAACNLEGSFYGRISRCTLTSQDVQHLKEDLSSHQDKTGLGFYKVKFTAEIAKEFMDMLEQSPGITELDLVKTNFPSTQLPHLINNPHLRALKLIKNNFAEADLLHLADNKNYHALHLGERNLSPQGLITILNSVKIQSLGLTNMTFSDEEMELIFKNNQQLIQLKLRNCHINQLTSLRYLDDLKYLDIDKMKLTEESIKSIGDRVTLNYLFISNSKLNAKDTLYFKQLTHLNSFLLSSSDDSNGLGDEGFKFISSLPDLENIYLYNQNITDAGAEVISQNNQLVYIGLSYNKITDKGAIALAHMPALDMLIIDSNPIGDIGGVELANSPLLTLSIENNLLTDVTALAFAARTLPMNHLVAGGNHFSPSAMDAVRNNPNIRYTWFGDNTNNSWHKTEQQFKYKIKPH